MASFRLVLGSFLPRVGNISWRVRRTMTITYRNRFYLYNASYGGDGACGDDESLDAWVAYSTMTQHYFFLRRAFATRVLSRVILVWVWHNCDLPGYLSRWAARHTNFESFSASVKMVCARLSMGIFFNLMSRVTVALSISILL